MLEEVLLDGTLEDKTFAPGYGEFVASVPTSDELVMVAVATPTDTADGPPPRALDRLADTATALYRAADRRHGRSHVARLAAGAHRQAAAFTGTGEVPPLLAEPLAGVLVELDAALDARSRGDLKQAAIDLALAVLDIEMRWDHRAGIDSDRVEAWQRQRRLDRAAGDTAGAAGDTVIRAIGDRTAG